MSTVSRPGGLLLEQTNPEVSSRFSSTKVHRGWACEPMGRMRKGQTEGRCPIKSGSPSSAPADMNMSQHFQIF